MFGIVGAHPLAHDINDCHADEQNQDNEDAYSHADAGTAKTLAAGGTIRLPAVIAIVTAAKAAAMGNLARTSTSQLWLVLYLNVVANDRH